MQQIRHYQIQRKIGEGGMGQVYLAFDSVIKRQVALKVMSIQNKVAMKRFLREAKTTSLLQCPNIVQVYDVFIENNCPFIAMQYIEGESLQNWAKIHHGFKDIAQLFLTIAETLQYAHSNHVIHRDLKPNNILIDQHGKPYLIDFGIAKISQVGDKRLTKTGQVIGTPQYMSPEQAAGEFRHLDQRSDIYSLGVILYEILTRKRLINSNSLMECLYQVIQEIPAFPRSINHKIPKNLETICMKALQKNPKKRYQSMQEMAQDLSLFLQNQSLQIAKPIRYYQWNLQKLEIIPVVALVVVVVTLFITKPQNKEKVKDKLYYDNLDSQSLIGEVLLERAAFYKNQNLYDKALKDYDRALLLDPENPLLYRLRAELNVTMNNTPQALMDYQKALELAPQDPELLLSFGNFYYTMERLSKAKELFDRALQINPKNLEALLQLAKIYEDGTLKNLEKAIDLNNQVLKLDSKNQEAHYRLIKLHLETQETQLSKKHADFCLQEYPEYPESHWMIGYLLYQEKKYEEAEKWFLQGIARDPHNANRYVFLARMRFEFLDKLKEAQQDLNKALICDPESVSAMICQAQLYSKQGEYDAAQKLYERYVQVSQTAKDFQKADSYFHRATFYDYLKLYQNAIDDYSKAISIAPCSEYYYHRANAYFMIREYSQAQEDLEKALAVTQNNQDSSKAKYLQLRFKIFRDLGLYEKALKVISQAIEIFPRELDLYLERAHLYNYLTETQDIKKRAIYYEKAEEDFQHVMKTAPDLYTGFQNLATFYRVQKDYKKAFDVLREAEKKGHDVFVDLVRTLQLDGHYQELHRLLDQKKQQAPDDYRIYQLEAESFRMQRLFDRAEQSYIQAIEKNDFSHLHSQLAELYLYHKSDYDKALKHINAVLKDSPNNVVALELKCFANIATKQYEQALKDCDAILNSAQNEVEYSHRAIKQKVYIYTTIGNFEEAEKELSALIKLTPDNKDLYYKRASLKLKMGKRQEAIEDLKKSTANEDK